MRELQIFLKLLYYDREHFIMPEIKKKKLWATLMDRMQIRKKLK